MNLSKKRILLTLFVLSLFSLTSMMIPTTIGTQNANNDLKLSAIESDVFIEDFTTTTYQDGDTTAFGWGTGTVTNARDFSLQILDHYYTESPVVDVEVQGRKAYLALYNTSSTDAITILNINDPTDMILQGIDGNHFETKAIAVEGDILVAGQHTVVQESLVVSDITDPFNPSWQVAYGTDNFVTDIEFYGHLVFYTSYNTIYNRSLRFFDLEDPFTLTGFEKCAWDCNLSLGLDVVGGFAYVAASTEGFYVLNITSKFVPMEVGYVNTPGNATDVIVDGGFAYLADGFGGVHVIDVRDPSNPTILSSIDTPGYARKLVKQGRTLFVADGDGGVQIFDVYDPNHITFVADVTAIPYTYDVALFDENLVVGTQDGVYTISIGYITNFANSWYPNPIMFPKVWDVRVINDIAYIAGGTDGVYVVDVSNPQQPILLDNYTTGLSYDIRKIDINGKFLYAVCSNGILIFNVAEPMNIKLVNSVSGMGLQDVFINGELLYIAFTTGFAILNVSNNYFESIITNFIPGIHSNNTAIWVQGTHVYMVEGDSPGTNTLSCYDISNFNSPVLADSRTRTTPMYDILVDGDVCYLGAGGWFAVYDVSDPTNLLYPGYEVTPSWGVWSFGRYVVSAERTNGVVLYDVSDLTNPTMQSQYTYATGAIQITTAGDYTYVANSSSLVILRHFESVADTYHNENNLVQSTPFFTMPNGTIYNATLNFGAKVPDGTNMEFFMTADGINWEVVTPGVLHTFANPGKTLQWRAMLDGERDRSVHLYFVEITYDFEYKQRLIDFSDPLWIGIFAGGGALILIIIIIAVVVSARRKKKVPTR
ncbi:MAG TPA: hypothetical protein VMZ29_15870 [Candidatus Bathyarchaeia archaeon]|nr:hypothetical protein [Candidatus Bathyarchaeia archaeon]